jgi:quercetin dioxygenase-like cupin family protein
MSINYYFDLDNTLCYTVGNDYTNSIPIQERIDYVNSLKELGHSITIWTARGKASNTDHTQLTTRQLQDWNIKYDVLKMDKPCYDVYIDDKSFNVDTLLPVPLPFCQSNDNTLVKTKKTPVEIVKKGWGQEIIFVNNDEYCGKLLCFEKGKKFSMHYHLQKKETWYVSKGKFILIWVETDKGITHTEYLVLGDTITNERGEPHQLIALEDSEVFEVSTKHYDEDSFRMWKGD